MDPRDQAIARVEVMARSDRSKATLSRRGVVTESTGTARRRIAIAPLNEHRA